jgi:nucleoside phosphorylase
MIYRVALLAALPLEVRPFLRRVRARRRGDLDLPAWEFGSGEGRGVLGLSGMGALAAWEAARQLLERCRPANLISLGFGGALVPGLEPGAAVLGQSFWHFHPDRGELQEIPAPAPPRPLSELRDRLLRAGLPVSLGSFVTTPYLIHKRRQGGPISHLACPVLDLESAAAAALADKGGVPFLGLRVITDAAGEEIPDFLAAWAPGRGPGPRVRTALAWLAADPRRLPQLLRLGRRGRAAARRLAEALGVLLPLI